MKCGACNYEYEISYKDYPSKVILGDEDFIDIQGTFYIENNSPELYS